MAVPKPNIDTLSTRPVVLVVDDSKTVRRSASGFLTDIGLSVVTASDGFEALAKVVESKPAMVFVDIMMPRLDGYQTCALIKNNADFRDIPVVMLSSKDGLFDRARGRVAGADGHLAKPFSANQMTETVAEHLKLALQQRKQSHLDMGSTSDDTSSTSKNTSSINEASDLTNKAAAKTTAGTETSSGQGE